jgi:hypothetical protein
MVHGKKGFRWILLLSLLLPFPDEELESLSPEENNGYDSAGDPGFSFLKK